VRTQLKKLNKTRLTIVGKVEGFGTKRAFKGPPIKTLLLTQVRTEEGTQLTDHLWFTDGAWSKDLEEGDIVQIDARVKPYQKGYRGRNIDALIDNPPRIDYKLSHPSKVQVLDRETDGFIVKLED